MRNKKVYENEPWYKEEKKLKVKRAVSFCITALSFVSTIFLFNYSQKANSDRKKQISSAENYIAYTQQMEDLNNPISLEKFVEEHGTEEQKAMWEKSKKTQDTLLSVSLVSFAVFALSSQLAVRYSDKYANLEKTNTKLKQEAVDKEIAIKEAEIKNMLNPFRDL